MKRFLVLCCLVLLTACAPLLTERTEDTEPPDEDMGALMIEEESEEAVDAEEPEEAEDELLPLNPDSQPELEPESDVEPQTEPEQGLVTEPEQEPLPEPEAEPEAAATKRIVQMTAENWAFSPASITAKKGETLEIEIIGIEGTHGFAVPDLGINQSLAAGETVTVSIPTDQTGSFSFRCSVPCGAGHSDMIGVIVIEE